jgi:hypothetical protein
VAGSSERGDEPLVLHKIVEMSRITFKEGISCVQWVSGTSRAMQVALRAGPIMCSLFLREPAWQEGANCKSLTCTSDTVRADGWDGSSCSGQCCQPTETGLGKT